MKTLDIEVWGIVQGVGFRPFVHHLALQHGIKGTVQNEGGFVHIVAQGEIEQMEAFTKDIHEKKPEASEIVSMKIMGKASNGEQYQDFTIIKSSAGNSNPVFIPPDLAVCSHCEQELRDGQNRRGSHPFISCIHCGPRYSIIEDIPYDRENTTMGEFPMCQLCMEEYRNASNRRHYAQTISCHNCGPVLRYKNRKGKITASGNAALFKIIHALKDNKIAAVKGIGGYHLCCSPFHADPVEGLRQLKGRDNKPFAVMFGSIAQVEGYCHVTQKEKELLLGRERPIVLLKRKASNISKKVYGNSRYLGVFLPYTPLHILLIEAVGPLVMTSANLSGQPIIIDDEKIMGLKHSKLAGVLYHERKILTGIDDSVIKCMGNIPQFIRRARGFAPLPLYLENYEMQDESILTCGGDLKNTFCLLHQGFAYVSQYGGDMESKEHFEVFTGNVSRLTKILKIKPRTVYCDLHPAYQTTVYAKNTGLKMVQIQHHYAHILSVLAEWDINGQVIGVAYDGTGYGTDGNVWGGEFLIASSIEFSRAGHLKYIWLMGGDSNIREVWKTSLSYLFACGMETYILDKRWEMMKAALENRTNTILSSSMGRLFDAVSGILGLKEVADYEGECAVMLEEKAAAYMALCGMDESLVDSAVSCYREMLENRYSYSVIHDKDQFVLDMNPCVKKIATEYLARIDISYIAFRFHMTVVSATVDICCHLRQKHHLDQVAISGGVFQNTIIFGATMRILREKGFKVYYNRKLPPNDGCISLGQAYAAVGRNSREESLVL